MTDSSHTTATPDAELLALGEVLDRLLAENHVLLELEEALGARWPAGKRDSTDVMNELDGPVQRIRSLPAMTIAGLAVKARLARFDLSDTYCDPDIDGDSLRSLIDGVLELAKT